jgi:hypothetical protein
MEDSDVVLAQFLQEAEFAANRGQQKGQLLGQLQGCMDKVIKVSKIQNILFMCRIMRVITSLLIHYHINRDSH